MSSRALTSDVLRKMYTYNRADGRSDIKSYVQHGKGEKTWRHARHRLLVHAVATIAFVCLLRLDEAANLRYDDLVIHSPTHIEVTLHSRKTHQYSGLSHFCQSIMLLITFPDSKPCHLWKLDPEFEALCSICALVQWIQACGLENHTGFLFHLPGSADVAPAPFQNKPIVSSFVASRVKDKS